MTNASTYAPSVLRIGLSLIILWFGAQQLMHVSDWVGYLPEWTTALPVTPEQLVYLNGLFEIVFGLFLLAGFYTRIAALLLALHMLEIVHAVGYGPTGARDLGLAFAIIAIFLQGPDKLSVDKLWQR
jgi:uncharacterized membrane protein YphA (DoxX/SURF4 family)